MYKKTTFILFLFTLGSTLIFGQEEETVLDAPSDWLSEIIPFPIGFAQDIDLVGFEDIRFSPNWRDSTSQEFWTYTFTWYVDTDTAMTERQLTTYLNSYYDGLMKVDFLNRIDTTKTNPVDKTISLVLKTDEGFTGKIRVYDNFFKKDYMFLYIKVVELFCPEMDKQIISFNISPKDFDHETWELFDKVKLRVKCE